MTYKMSGGHIGHTPTTGGGNGDAAPGVWQLGRHIYPKTVATSSIVRNWPLTEPVVTDPVYSTVMLRLPLNSNLTDQSNSAVSADDQSVGKTFVTGKFSNALNVAQGYINYPTGTYVPNTGSNGTASTHTATLEFWLKSTNSTYGSSDKLLLDLGTTGSTNQSIVGNGNEIRYRFGSSTSSSVHAFHTYTQNTWHHYLIQWHHILSFSPTSHFWQWELFVDGNASNQQDANLQEVPNKFSIGAGSGVTSSFYLDDVRITSGNTRIGGAVPSTYTVPTAEYPTS